MATNKPVPKLRSLSECCEKAISEALKIFINDDEILDSVLRAIPRTQKIWVDLGKDGITKEDMAFQFIWYNLLHGQGSEVDVVLEKLDTAEKIVHEVLDLQQGGGVASERNIDKYKMLVARMCQLTNRKL